MDNDVYPQYWTPSIGGTYQHGAVFVGRCISKERKNGFSSENSLSGAAPDIYKE